MKVIYEYLRRHRNQSPSQYHPMDYHLNTNNTNHNNSVNGVNSAMSGMSAMSAMSGITGVSNTCNTMNSINSMNGINNSSSVNCSNNNNKVSSRHIICNDSIIINKELGVGEFGVVQQGLHYII